MPGQLRDRVRRTTAVMRKEMIQRLRDRRTLAIILAMPLSQLLLFAYAVDLTADHLPTVIADQSLDAESRAFIDALVLSGYFCLEAHVADEAAVIRAIDEGRARAGVVIPPGFAAQVERGDAQALIILDGSDSFSVQAGYSAATAIAQARALDLLAAKVSRLGGDLETSPIRSSARVLYNPNLDDLIFIMPGLIAMLLQVLAVNTTAQSIVREYELGTIEQILITPVRPIELVVGKLVPNVFLVIVNQIVITLLGVLWFGVPFRGSLWLFVWLSLLFIVSGLGLGLLISTIAQTQKQAQQLTSLLMMLSQLLTGFIYPRAPMPPAVKAIGNLIPLTYFPHCTRHYHQGDRHLVHVERCTRACALWGGGHVSCDGDVQEPPGLTGTQGRTGPNQAPDRQAGILNSSGSLPDLHAQLCRVLVCDEVLFHQDVEFGSVGHTHHRCVQHGLKLRDRLGGSSLCRHLLATTLTLSIDHTVDHHSNRKQLVVVRPVRAYRSVTGRVSQVRLAQFLQHALGILVEVVLENVLQRRLKDRHGEIADLRQALIQVKGADQCLERATEYGRTTASPTLILAPPEQQMIAQADLVGKLGQRARTDQGRTQAGQRAFILIRKACIEVLADDKVEHRIAQELETLVVLERMIRIFV